MPPAPLYTVGGDILIGQKTFRNCSKSKKQSNNDINQMPPDPFLSFYTAGGDFF